MDFKHFKEKLEALVTGDSPYSCPKCDVTMNNKWLIARHMAGVHGFRDKFLNEALKEKAENSPTNEVSSLSEATKSTTKYGL